MSLKAMHEQQKQQSEQTESSQVQILSSKMQSLIEINQQQELKIQQYQSEKSKQILIISEQKSLIAEQADEIAKQKSMIAEQESIIAEQTDKLETLYKSDLKLNEAKEKLKEAEEIENRSKKRGTEVVKAVQNVNNRTKALDEKERELNEREKNLQSKIRKAKEEAEERADSIIGDRIAEFDNEHFGILLALWITVIAQDVFKFMSDPTLRDRFAKTITFFSSIPEWSIERKILTAVLAIAGLAFFGYQYLKRFRDRITLTVILVSIAVVEFFAQQIINAGGTLFLIFIIIQGIYVLMRDMNDDNSRLRAIMDFIS